MTGKGLFCAHSRSQVIPRKDLPPIYTMCVPVANQVLCSRYIVVTLRVHASFVVALLGSVPVADQVYCCSYIVVTLRYIVVTLRVNASCVVPLRVDCGWRIRGRAWAKMPWQTCILRGRCARLSPDSPCNSPRPPHRNLYICGRRPWQTCLLLTVADRC